jgi:hypothetical protein
VPKTAELQEVDRIDAQPPSSDSDEKLPPRRLVVELNRRSAADLAWLCEAEELNKTTVVNRAVQLYKMLVQAQLEGERVKVQGERGDRELVIL